MKNISLFYIIVLIISSSFLIAEEQENLGIPRLVIITKNLDFGDVPLGEERILEIQVKNISIRTFNSAFIYGFTIVPDDKDFFMLDSISEYNPVKLYEGDKKSFEVKFRPTSIRDYSSVLYVQSNAEGVVPIYLTGSSTKYISNVKFTPEKIEFKTTLQKDTISRFLFIETVGKREVEIKGISMEDKDNLFSFEQFVTIPVIIKDNGLSIRIDLVPNKVGTYTNYLLIKSSDSLNPLLKVPIVAQIGAVSSVEELSESTEFDFNIIEEGNIINFSILAKTSLKAGTFTIYSQEGKLIKTVNVSGNSSEVSVTIDKNEIPKLFFIRITLGERVYTHKFVRE